MLQSNGNKLEDYFKLPNPKLRSYFGKVIRGDSAVIESPFGKGEAINDVLNSWDKILVSISDKFPSLYQFEMDMRGKVGPMSVQKPLRDRLDSIQDYYRDVKGNFSEVNPSAVKAVIKEWRRLSGLLPRSYDRTIDQMKLTTNSGNPYFIKRREALLEMHKALLLRTTSMTLQDINNETWNTCAVLGWRGQEGGENVDDVKQRVVWMFPLLVNIIELSIYQVGIEGVQKFNLVPAYVSMEAVDQHVTKLFESKEGKDLIMCTDFTSFDSHFNYTLQHVAHEVLGSIFTNNEEMRKWLEVVFPIKYNIDLALTPDLIISGSHGMGSGSGGTNFDETLAHRALQYEAAILQKQKLNVYSQCLGDDGIISYPNLDPTKVIESYTQHGLEMNESKQYISSKDCVYLRRWHHENYRQNGICVGVYSTMRALGRLRYQERYYTHWSNKMVALRQLSILENVKYHPLREKFVDFCMKRDKYRLGLDIPGFIDGISKIADEATAYMPDFLGYTKSMQKQQGIETWWIVNYLKSLS